MKIYTISLALILALPVATYGQGNETPAERPPFAFSWWNDVPEMIRRGNEYYNNGDFENAELDYRDAQLRAPQDPTAAFNLGLLATQQRRYEEALRHFERARSLGGTDPSVRRDISYNSGVAAFNEAVAAAVGDTPNRDLAIAKALEAIDHFDEALRIDPESEDAKFNRRQAQHLLDIAAEPPQPEEQQQQGDGNESEDTPPEQNEDGEPQESGEDEQPPEDEQEGEPQDGEGDQQQDSESEPQQQEGGSSQQRESEPRPEGLTQEEAEALLNLLGDEDRVPLRQRSTRLRQPEKDW